jgi:hypothetical protein
LPHQRLTEQEDEKQMGTDDEDKLPDRKRFD